MGGYVYHVLNRAVGRATLFYQEGDYAAFENTLRGQGVATHPPVGLRTPAHFEVPWDCVPGDPAGIKVGEVNP